MLQDARWYVVRAKTGRESAAQTHLVRQGFMTFLPMHWRVIRHARKRTAIRSAYFPGYLFTRINPLVHRWRCIDSTHYVLGLIKANDRPIPVPAGLVEAFLEATGEDGVLRAPEALALGAKVRVTRGPFLDQLATVEKLTGQDRVRVLISLLNRQVQVDIERGDVSLETGIRQAN